MAAARVPGTTGLGGSSEALTGDSVRFAPPGIVCRLLNGVPFELDELSSLAGRVALNPAHGKSVFYHGSGGDAAARFVQQDPSYTRLDDLLLQTVDGRELLARLRDGQSWSDTRDVWWELSRRLARESSGDVHVFGDGRYVAEPPSSAGAALEPGELTAFKGRFAGSEHKYADTVFEKIELPELESNPRIDTIYYNGVDIDAFEEPVRTRPRSR